MIRKNPRIVAVLGFPRSVSFLDGQCASRGLLGGDSFWYTARNRFVFWCSGRREIANKKRGFLGISSFELPVLETV